MEAQSLGLFAFRKVLDRWAGMEDNTVMQCLVGAAGNMLGHCCEALSKGEEHMLANWASLPVAQDLLQMEGMSRNNSVGPLHFSIDALRWILSQTVYEWLGFVCGCCISARGKQSKDCIRCVTAFVACGGRDTCRDIHLSALWEFWLQNPTTLPV